MPKKHPIRTIRAVAYEALERLSPGFDRMYPKGVNEFVVAPHPAGNQLLVVYDVTGTAVGATGSIPSSAHPSR